MKTRAVTAYGVVMALLTFSTPPVSGQQQAQNRPLPSGWTLNWDGSGTYVFLGSPGTGNVGRIPGRVDISQTAYSAAHPGWNAQLVEHVKSYQTEMQAQRPGPPPGGPLPPGWILNWDGSGTYVFLGNPGTGNVGHTPGHVDISQTAYSAAHPGWNAQLIEHVKSYQTEMQAQRPGPPPGGPLPPGWILNWDGSGTYVFLGNPGTGNVGHAPGRVDITQAAYSTAHPGWYAQLLEHLRANQQPVRPQNADHRPDQAVPEDRGQAQGEDHEAHLPVSPDHSEGERDRSGPERPDLPAGWVPNWDGSDTYVFLGDPGTGNVGRVPGRVDFSQAAYSTAHPGWNEELLEHIHRYRDHPEGNEWGHDDHPAGFSDHDRRVTREWYQENRSSLGPGWRQDDRLAPDEERRLRPGERLDWPLRRQVYWLPDDLIGRYGPGRRDHRCGVIGGHVVMLDKDYVILDVFRVDADDR